MRRCVIGLDMARCLCVCSVEETGREITSLIPVVEALYLYKKEDLRFYSVQQAIVVFLLHILLSRGEAEHQQYNLTIERLQYDLTIEHLCSYSCDLTNTTRFKLLFCILVTGVNYRH
jgi:hypothetical protein